LESDADAAAPAPRARRAARPARAGSFGPMTMDDRTASSGDSETVEI
jgi:hypothetical protein